MIRLLKANKIKNLIIISLISLIGMLVFVYHPQKANAAWLSDWAYRKKITITGQTGAGTLYQVKLLVGETSGATGEQFDLGGNSAIFPTAENNGGDLRFTANDGQTLLSFWVESVSGTTPNRLATIWVKVSADLGTNQDIYIYYGNSGASNVSNGDNTFLLFDDFEDGTLDSSKWGTEIGLTGVVEETNGYLRQSSSGDTHGQTHANVYSQSAFTAPYAVDFSFNIVLEKNNQQHLSDGQAHIDQNGIRTLLTETYRLWQRCVSGTWTDENTFTSGVGNHRALLGIDQNNYGRLVYDGASYVTGATINASLIKYIYLYNSDSLGEAEIQHYFIFVRKFLSVDPAFNLVGSEEKKAIYIID